jgi:predicted nuclease of restriction endonuclease-like (RecB) superfamily
MRIENPNERSFYEIECVANNWSLKELQRQFDSALTDLLKDPYILEFLDLPEQHRFSENDLETAIIDKLEHFLLELGKGFTYVGRQVRITIDEKHFKVDLVFFNRILRCFVVFDLKIGELSHQDIGQMQMYVNYHDRYLPCPMKVKQSE